MPQFISTNVTSIIARNNLDSSSSELSTSIERLSSGQRINSSKDDAAGMAIASRMTSQIRGMKMAKRNTLDAISMTQTTEGALGTQVEQLQRIRELAVQASNGILGVNDRSKLDNEAQALIDEIDRIATASSFNGNLLLSHKGNINSAANNSLEAIDIFGSSGTISAFSITGSSANSPVGLFTTAGNTISIDYTLITDTMIGNSYSVDVAGTDSVDGAQSFTRKYQVQSTGEKDANGVYGYQLVDSTYNNMVNFQVGSDEGQRRTVEFVPTTTVDLGLISEIGRLTLADVSGAQKAIGLVDAALIAINNERSNMGAYQNRLGQTISNLNSSIENTSASRSRIEDTDFAEETAIMTKNQTLHQAGIAMLQQANSLPESVLSLLK